MKTCERNILAIVSCCIMSACGCSIVARAQPAEKTARETCPWTGSVTCATIPTSKLGKHLTLRPDKDDAIPIREVTDESETATKEKVRLRKVTSGCGQNYPKYLSDNSDIFIIWNDSDKEYYLKIEAQPGGKSYSKIHLAPERKELHKPVETVDGHVYWMRGSELASGYDYSVQFFVYLYDEQEDENSPMGKHYLVEVFDQNCNQDSPTIDGNVRPRDDRPHPSKGKVLQPSTGNGWEPHHS